MLIKFYLLIRVFEKLLFIFQEETRLAGNAVKRKLNEGGSGMHAGCTLPSRSNQGAQTHKTGHKRAPGHPALRRSHRLQGKDSRVLLQVSPQNTDSGRARESKPGEEKLGGTRAGEAGGRRREGGPRPGQGRGPTREPVLPGSGAGPAAARGGGAGGPL